MEKTRVYKKIRKEKKQMTKQMLTSEIREKLRKSYRKISETKHKRRIRYTSFIHPLECMKRYTCYRYSVRYDIA